MAAIELLGEKGPALGRPAVDRIEGSRHHNHIDDIRKCRPLSPQGRKRVDDIERAMRLKIALVELREMRGATQASAAEELSTSRPNVGRIEKELDIRLSTLERYVEALGGRLELHAVFDDDDVKLTA